MKMPNPVPTYIRDAKTGRLMRAEDFMKREAVGWAGAFKQVFKECKQTGKEFTQEVSGFIASGGKK